MPQVRAKFKGGKEVQFFVPEGTSQQQINSMAPGMYRLQQQGVDVTQEPEWDRSVLGHVGQAIKGVPRGAIHGIGSAATGLAQLLPEGAEVPTREFIQRATDVVASPFEPNMRYEDAMSGKFGEALGSTVPLIGASLVGSPVTGAALATTMAGAMGSGEAIQRAQAAGATEEQISEAGVRGLVPGLGEMLVPFIWSKGIRAARTAKKLQETVGEEAAFTILDRIRRAGMAAGGEGAQEAASEIAQNMIARDIYAPDTDIYGGVTESFGLGAGVGGFIQALVDLALPRGRGAGGAPPPAADGGPQPGRDLVPVGPVNTPPTLEGGDKARPVGLLEPPSGTQGELFSYEEAPPTVMRLPGTVAGITEQDLDDVDPRQMTIEDQMRRNDDYGRRAELRENYDRAEAQRATNQARETVQQEVERRIREAQEQVAQQRRVAAEAQQQRSVASPTSVVGKRGTEEQQDTTEPATRVPEREGPQPEQLDMGFPLSEPAPANPAMAQAMEAALRRAQQPAAQRTEPDEQPRQEQPAPTPTEQPEQAEQSVEAPVQAQQETAQPAPVAQEVATPEEATPPSPSASFTPSSYDIIRRQYGERADEVAQDIVAKSTVTGRKLGIKDVTDYIATEQAATTEPVQPTKRPAAAPRAQDQEMERAKPLAERVQEVEPAAATPEQETQPDDDNVWPDEEPGDNELEVARPISDEERQELSAGVFERARLEPERIPYTGNDSSIVANLIKSRPKKDTPKGAAAYYFDTYGIAGGLNVMAAEVAEGASYSRNESLPEQRAKRAMEWVRNTPGLSDSMRRSLEREFSVEQERVAAAKRASRRVTPQKKKDTIAARRNTALNRELRQVERDTEDRAEAADADGEIRENQGQQADSRPAARRRERPDNALPIPKGLRRAVLLAVDADVGETIGEVVDRRASNYATAMSGLSRSNVLDPINLKRLSKQLQSQITGWMSTQELDLIEGNAKNRGELDIARRALMQNLLDFMSNPNISEEQVQSAAKVYADLRKRKLELKSSAIAASTQPLSEPVMSALEKGDLTAALESVRDEVGNKWVARIADILSKNVGDTRVELDDTIDTAGHFDPNTNTIRINPAVGANIHTLLHEMTHAATSHILSNANHAVTQQLRKIYEQVKEESPTYYGTQSLDEFVAEAWSNPDFQHMLENMGYMGSRRSVFRKFVDAIKNWFHERGYFQSPGITNSPDIDELILSIVDTAPRNRAAPILNSVTADMFGNTGYGIHNKTREAFAPKYDAAEAMSQLRNAIKYAGRNVGEFVSKWLLAAPQYLEAVAPIVGEDITNKMINLIRDHSGLEHKMAERSKATAIRISNWIKSVDLETRKTMSEVMSRSTRAGVNPATDGTQYKGEKAQIYRELREKYMSLGEEGMKLYPDMLKGNDYLYDAGMDALVNYVRQTLSGENAEAVVNLLATKLRSKKRKDPYFQLGRPHGGGAWVIMQTYVEDANGDVKLDFIKITFPNERDAKAFIADVRSDPQAYTALDLANNPQAKQDMLDSLEMPTRLDLKYVKKAAPESSFTHALFKILEDVDDDVQTRIMETVLDYTSEQSILKAFHQRKEVPGYGDMLSAYARNIQRTSRNIANLTYAREFYGLAQDIETMMSNGRLSATSIKQRIFSVSPISDLQAFRDNSELSDMEKSYVLDMLDKLKSQGLTGAELEQAYRNGVVDLASEIQAFYNKIGTELVSRARYAAAPKSATWATIAKTVGFGWTMGLYVSSVVMNGVQVPAITYPILGGEYGYKRSFTEIKNAVKIYTTVLGMSRTETDFSGAEVDMGALHAPSLLNIVGDRTLFGRLKKTVEDGNSGLSVPISEAEVVQLQELGKRLRAKGALGHSMVEEQQELQEADAGSMLTKVNNVQGAMFHIGERANREVSMIAAFRLEMARLNGEIGTRKSSEMSLTEEQKFDLAAEKALYISDFTHGSAHMRGRAKMAQSNVGNVLSMYKSYGATMYYLLYKTANNMLAGESKEVRAIARRQMAGIFGMVGMLSGAAGLPMMGVIGMIHDFFKEDDEEDFKTLMRYYLGDLGTEGLLNNVTNLGFSERTSMSSLLYRASPVANQDNKFYAFMEPLLGPTFGMVSRADRVTDLMGEGQYQRAFEAALPAFASSVLRAGRFATEGAQTMRGDPIDEDINAWNVLAQAFGFAPADYLRKLEQNAAIKGIERGINTQRSKLLERYALARRFGDYETLVDIDKEMREFSQKHPEFALDQENINNSMRQRDANTKQARRFNGLVLDRRFEEDAMRMQREFGIGFSWED